MNWPESIMDRIREETHFDGRLLRSFTERPADLNEMFADALARNPDG
jgi:hypothetical protein